MKTRRILFALLLLCPPIAFAAEGGQAAAAKVREYIEISGLDGVLGQLPGYFEAAQNQHAPGVPFEVQEQLARIYAESFSPAALHQGISAGLLRRYDEPRFDAALAQLRTPLAKKMSRLEVEASGVAAQQEIMRFAQNAVHLPRRERR